MSMAPRPSGDAALDDEAAVVSFGVCGKRFGIEIARVEDVFIVHDLTPVPLAPRSVVGVLNLRGKVVTAICLRRLLGLTGPGHRSGRQIAIGVARAGETYGFLIDEVGEVTHVAAANRETVGPHLREPWTRFARAIHKTDPDLLVELDPDKLTRLDPDFALPEHH